MNQKPKMNRNQQSTEVANSTSSYENSNRSTNKKGEHWRNIHCEYTTVFIETTDMSSNNTRHPNVETSLRVAIIQEMVEY